MGQNTAVRILFVEDTPGDREIAEGELRRDGMESEFLCVETREAFVDALRHFDPVVVVSDYSLVQFDCTEALRLAREHDPFLPFVVLTDSTSENIAVECIRSGASDYVIKQQIARLPFAVRGALARADAARSEAKARALQEAGREALRQSEERYRRVSELISDYAYSFTVEADSSLTLEWVTREAFQRITLCDAEESEALGSWQHLLHPDDGPIAVARFQHLLRGEPDVSEYRIIRKDGDVRWLRDAGYPEWDVSQQRVVRIVGAAQDITERKLAEQALRASEDRYRTLFAQSVVPMSLISPDGHVTEANPAWLDLFGYAVDDLQALNIRDFYLDPAERARFLERIDAEGRVVDDEVRLKRKDGTVLDLLRSVSVRRGPEGDTVGYQTVFRDITERKRAEVALCESEERFRRLFEQSVDAIWLVNRDGSHNEANQAWLDLFGYSREELASMNAVQLYENPDDREDFVRRMEENGFVKGEVRYRRKDGTVFDCERHALAVKDETGAVVRFQGVMRDVSVLKRAREEERRQRIFAEALMETSPACIVVFGADRRIVFANAETDRVLGLPRDQVVGMTCGQGFRLCDLSGAPLPEGEQPPCRVFLSEMPVYSLEYFFESPTGKRVLSISAAPVYDENGSVSQVVATIEDVTARKQREREREQALERLERAMEATVSAVSTAVEMRDPYTAGHQTRVTRLACAMAAEMGMGAESIHVLAMAGQVHDIGKLRIPAEILAMPRKLTAVEYRLMQEHPQASYDLLKGIEFAGPVADIAYQHHERLDGSGYPQGLKGEEMLPESRVLAVADVFEAMSSHRPYRAALGVDAALEELQAKRGSLYDPAAVDACARLIREKGFTFD